MSDVERMQNCKVVCGRLPGHRPGHIPKRDLIYPPLRGEGARLCPSYYLFLDGRAGSAVAKALAEADTYGLIRPRNGDKFCPPSLFFKVY